MATSPTYFSTPHVGAALITALETDLAVPTQAVSVFVGATNGSKIEEITVEAVATSLVATTVAGLVYIFLYNGTTYYLRDVYTVTAITASATVAGFHLSTPYNNLLVPNGWTLYASQSETSNDSKLLVIASGADA